MPKYIVFDVETPNRYNNRMSAIGISIVENGKIIDAKTVAHAPTFPELWKKIEPILSSGVLVAHNASFDMGVLKKCLKDYNIPWKSTVSYCCTVQIGRKVLPEISHKLNNVCDHYGICLDHHRADSDSSAAAKILIRYIENGAVITDYVKQYML